MKFINVNGRGPIFEGGEVRSFPVQDGAHERSEADILDSLASALRARARIDGAIVTLRGLAAEFTDRALPELAEAAEGERRGRDISKLGEDIKAANEAGKRHARELELERADAARLEHEGEVDRALSTTAHRIEDAEIRQAHGIREASPEEAARRARMIGEDPDVESQARARTASRLAREDDN